MYFFSFRGKTREKQHRCLPADGEEHDSSSPCQSGEPAALQWAEHDRSHAQQSEHPARLILLGTNCEEKILKQNI